MHDFKWLQMFAEGGAGDGGGNAAGAAPTGDTAAAAAQQSEETVADRLRRKGVPESKLSRRAYQQRARVQNPAPAPAEAEGQAAAAEDPAVPQQQEKAAAEGEQPAAAQKLSFEELMQDPDYNREMQKVVQKRLAKSKAAEQKLNELTPTLQKLAKRYGLESDFTAEELAERVDNDDSYYEQKAMELGVPPEIARKIEMADAVLEQRELDRAEREKAEEQDQRIRETFDRLQGQIAGMQEKYPGFDFAAELQDPRFVHMVQPGGGLSLEDAYVAIHRDEILAAERKAAEQRIAATVQANRARPRETPTSHGSTDTLTALDWKKSTKEQREALKKRIRSGERVLPGQGYR